MKLMDTYDVLVQGTDFQHRSYVVAAESISEALEKAKSKLETGDEIRSIIFKGQVNI